jgi:hypothetical protein
MVPAHQKKVWKQGRPLIFFSTIALSYAKMAILDAHAVP